MAFQKLRQFAIKPEATARLELTGISLSPDGEPPVLILRHAGEENPAYKSALAKAQVDVKAIGNGKGDAAVRARLVVQARLYATAGIVASWEKVHEDDGKPAECSPAKVEELLTGLLDETPDLFYAVIATASNVANFRSTPAVDVEALGKP